MVGDVEWLRCGRKTIFLRVSIEPKSLFTGHYRPFLYFDGSLSDFPLLLLYYNVIEIVLAETEAYRVPREYKDKHFLEAQKSIGSVARVLFRSHCRCYSRCGRRLLNNCISASRASHAN